MESPLHSLKILLQAFRQAPVSTVSGTVRSLALRVWVPGRVTRLREMVSERPIILQVETTNACNAACQFCAYPGMKRQKGVMDLPLFEKVMGDYVAMGGGALTLTPIVGDPLLDPHLLERLDILERYPEINQVTLTTNAIGLERYSDDQVRRLLSSLYCMQLSIGGMDSETYRTMYGVDRFPQVRQAMERLIDLAQGLERPAHITFAFRTNDPAFERRFHEQLEGYRCRGVHISHIWTYANYSGAVSGDEKINLVVARNKGEKRIACVTPSMCVGVCWDGRVTACSCADFNADKLLIGDARQESLAQLWKGERRAEILASFPRGALRPICRGCSAYTPDTFFAYPCFKGVEPGKEIPLDFYHNMMT